MQRHTATVAWDRAGAAFTDNRYGRAHRWRFDGGAVVPASSSPASVPVPMSDPSAVDPEEALVAATSSCHMLWFLSLAARAGLVVDSYVDEACGTLATPPGGGAASFTRIVLRPRIAWTGRVPPTAEVDELHARAHAHCYIASSLKAEVVVEPPA